MFDDGDDQEDDDGDRQKDEHQDLRPGRRQPGKVGQDVLEVEHVVTAGGEIRGVAPRCDIDDEIFERAIALHWQTLQLVGVVIGFVHRGDDRVRDDVVDGGERVVRELLEEPPFEHDTTALEIAFVLVGERRVAVGGVIVVGVDEEMT